MKSAIVHLDGADKTGKDSVRRFLVKEHKGNCLVYVRSFISQIAYGRIYNRNINEKFFWREFIFSGSIFNHKFFLLTCDEIVAAKRFIENNEKDILISDFIKHQNVFLEVAEEANNLANKYSNKFVFTIDTSKQTIQDTCFIIDLNLDL